MTTRTANCKCGSVNLNIVPKSGKVEFTCKECGKYVKTLNYGKYVTINSECKKCNGKSFKIKVTNNEDKNSQNWSPYCTNCGEEPTAFYADEKGNVIDRGVRELLIIRDSIEELGQRVDSLDSAVEINSYTISEHENSLYELQSDLGHCESKVSDFDSSIYDLKRDIESCESSVSDLQTSCESQISDIVWKVDRLE